MCKSKFSTRVNVLISIGVTMCVVSGGVQMVKCCEMIRKTGVLQKYLSDEQKQLEAVNALQELAVHLELNGECLSFVYGLGPQ